MTAKQFDTLMFINQYIREHGYAPLQKEIGAHFGVTQGAIEDRISKLLLLGYIRKDRYAVRGLEVVRLPGGARV